MADIFAQSAAGGGGHRLDWTLDFNDAADTVTITATHTRLDGSPQKADPQQAAITVTLNTGASVSVDLLTGLMSTGGQFSQASPGKIVNQGPKTRTSVRVKISADRAQLITFSTSYLPPA